jgi:signal transduction histidine kinase
MRRQARPDVRTGRLRAADPFELIRWLARSQTDPRKALAELVQNSLDAQARTVTITRVRERGVTTLRVRDDGEGVIPELERSEALHRPRRWKGGRTSARRGSVRAGYSPPSTSSRGPRDTGYP